MKTKIEAGNKLIAESPFSDFTVGKLRGWVFGDRGVCAYKKDKKGEIIEVCPIDKLKFHSDWGLLMPVVQKIYFGDFATVEQWDKIVSGFKRPNIQTVWSDVIEFIKQYNKKLKS